MNNNISFSEYWETQTEIFILTSIKRVRPIIYEKNGIYLYLYWGTSFPRYFGTIDNLIGEILQLPIHFHNVCRCNPQQALDLLYSYKSSLRNNKINQLIDIN